MIKENMKKKYDCGNKEKNSSFLIHNSLIKKALVFTLFTALVVMAGLLAACQPTPDEEIVISRDNTEKEVYDSAQENDKESDINFVYETPEHITDRYAIVEGSLDVKIDADVNMPDIDSVPVAMVTTDLFTQERADELREYFTQDGKLVTEKVWTKADYDEWIVEAKKGHLVDGEYVYDEDSERWVKQLLEERENAPDEDVQDLITNYSIFQENGLNGRIIIDGQEKGSIYITENTFSFYLGKTYRSATRKNYDETTGEEIEMPQKDIDFTVQQATDMVQEVFGELGIEGMAVVESDLVYFMEGDDYDGDIKCGGYELVFMREFGGMVPFVVGGYGMGPNDNFDVSPPVELEQIRVVVDEFGEISSLYWRYPVKIIETLTEHVDILPFEDIMTRLEEFTKQQYAYRGSYGSDVLMLIDIYDISLCLNYLPIKNNPTEFMYAPCWVFKYKDWQEYTDEQLETFAENGYAPIHWDEMSDDHIIFSAVDGASVSVYTSEDYEEMMEHSAMSTPVPVADD